MSTWQKVLTEVKSSLLSLTNEGCDTVFFRGHRDTSWTLNCSLGRGRKSFSREDTEARLYYDFMSHGGPLLPRGISSWDVAFAMQHHGLPTRFLDWSCTFSVALYFAINPITQSPKSRRSKTACVWMLNPFNLNEHAGGEQVILNPELDLEGSYYEYFITGSKSLGTKVMAVNPTRATPRQAAQKSAFTLHNDIWSPLEEFAPNQLLKIEIPESCFPEAQEFLTLAGINEYSLFPDFDGLARQLRHDNAKYF